MVVGDFNGDGIAGRGHAADGVDAGRRRRDVPARRTPGCCPTTATMRWRSWPATSPATATSTWPSPMMTGRYRLCCCWATATARSSPQVHLRGRFPGRRPSDGHRGRRLHRRRPPRPGRRLRAIHWRAPIRAVSSVLLGNGDGTFQPRRTSYADARAVDNGKGYASDCDLVAGDFTGDGHLDLAVANGGAGTVSVLLGNGDGTFQAPGHVRGGGRARSASWRATSPATASSTWPSQLAAPRMSRCCWATATARSSPAVTTRSGYGPNRDRGGGLHRRRPARPGRRQLDANGGNDVSVLLGNGDGTFQAARRYLRGRATPSFPRWSRRTSTATAGSTWPWPPGIDGDVDGAAGQRRRHVRSARSRPDPGGR